MQVGSFALAGLLLYLSLRGIDVSSILQAFREADYRWLVPLVLISLGSHGLRAWRWQVLIDALPEVNPPDESSDSSGQRPTVGAAFSSLMIGYMVNYAAPRLGEVARTANLSARTSLNFSGLFGTVVVERMLDMAVLALALLSLIPLFSGQLAVLETQFLAPALAQLNDLPVATLLLLAAGGLLIVGLLAVVLRRAMAHEQSAVRQLWLTRLQPALVSFRDGLMTLLRSPRRGTLIISTLLMWLGYAFMAYLPLIMLGLADPYDLGLLDAWALMAIGALGLVVPSPGGLGSYHYVTIQALVHLYSVPEAPAATYAVITHAAQLVLYVSLGGILLALQGSSFRALRHPAHPTSPADQGSSPEPSDEPTAVSSAPSDGSSAPSH